MNNIIKFTLGKWNIEARVEDAWVEFNFYHESKYWFRKFVSKAGYTGPNEIPEVARNILAAKWAERKGA